MTAKFNLMDEGKGGSIDVTMTAEKVIRALAAAFLALSAVFFVCGCCRLYTLRSECAEIRQNLAASGATLQLDREYSTAKERNDDIESRYDFVLEGIPAVQFLSGLVDAVPDGVIIERAAMSDFGCSLSGIAFGDEEIYEFADALAAMPAVLHAAQPVITPIKINGALLKKYSVEITLNSLTEIITAPEDTESADTAEEEMQ